MAKKQEPNEYLNDLKEWNEHQYDPGYWTGGKLAPFFKYGFNYQPSRFVSASISSIGLLFVQSVGNLIDGTPVFCVTPGLP